MTVLVDTSIWIEHLRRGRPGLVELLQRGLVLCHPYVVGELACGNLSNRIEILALLDRLPHAPLARHEEVRLLLEWRRLMGRGLGWVDVNLLASSLLAKVQLWTSDRRLADIAYSFGLAYTQ